MTEMKPTFICGHRRSGTTLLTSILDFHDELLVYPEDSKFFHLFYPNISKSDLSIEDKEQFIIDNNIEYLKSVIYEKCNAEKTYLNIKKLTNIFKQYAKCNGLWKNYLDGLIFAFYETTPQPKKNIKRWVEKTTSSEIFALQINKEFPESKFIHMLRDPRDNYASMKSGWQQKYRHLSDSSTLEMLLQSCIDRGRLGMQIAKYNEQIIGMEKYLIIRYEDFVVYLESSLNSISEFLEIKRNKFVENPTLCGLFWGGNNMQGQKFESVSKKQVGSWRERIDRHEAALIEFHFSCVMENYGYKSEFTQKEQALAAIKHYEWVNFQSQKKADFSKARKL